PGLYIFKLDSEIIASYSQPGQFVEADPGESFFLRRPFSIQEAEDGLEILVKVVGRGTAELVKNETEWNILGPLGRGFDFQNLNGALLIGGGVGVAPLKFLYKRMTRRQYFRQPHLGLDKAVEQASFWGDERTRIRFVIGAKTKSEIPIAETDYIRQKVIVSTDDGSEGFRGTVVDMLKAQSKLWEDNPKIYACGPAPMLKALYEFMLEKGLDGQFSLENRMACGMGVCQGCAIPMKNGYKLVCKDGPVFDFKDLDERTWMI
ncbi:MAG: dihydroorotate dehydrogenase electron transfer subunit, partial [FCB group bacterium]|nr:dihydroorotate dehydrogenase electron transfer subunit [FCB group bacterium]